MMLTCWLVLFKGGDLSRVEGRSVKPYWTLLFSDLLLFAKVSRDRVLFITEEPIPLANITDTLFNIRKKCKSSDGLAFVSQAVNVDCRIDNRYFLS